MRTLFLLLFILFCGTGFTQSIWTNPITGTNPSSTNPYTAGQTVNANITVSGIGFTGVSANAGNDRFNCNSWNVASLNTGKYFSFTLTPNSGYEIDFISFVYTGQASGTGPTSFAIRSSVDGYAANIGTANETGTTISLSAAAYQGISGPITFRFYAWGASGSTGTYSINSFTFNGTVSSATSITTGTVTGAPFFVPSCRTSGTVAFTSVGTYSSGNIYTAQLSNASGTFGSPVSIGTLPSTANSGSINFTIPPGTPAGTGYRIRVISSNPSVTGSTSSAFTINNGSSGTAGLWTGMQSTDWTDCRNWSNYAVPGTTTDVIINQTSGGNCAVTGSGAAVCRNVTLSSSNGTNRSLTLDANSTLTVSGNVLINKTAGSGTLTMELQDNARLNCVNITLSGYSPGSEHAEFKHEESNTYVLVDGDFTINPGGRLDMSNGGGSSSTLELRGNYTNNGLETDFKQTGSTILFSGTANQTISTNSFNEVFWDIELQKSSGNLVLNAPSEVEGNVTFTNGYVNSDLTNLFIFRDGSTATGMSDNSFVNGPVRKIGDDAFVFPIGISGNYQPAGISSPSQISDHFTAQYFHADPNIIYDETQKDASLDHISNCEYWIIDRTNGASSVNITLSWNSLSCGVDNPADLRVARWDGGQWRDQGNGVTTGNTITGTIGTSGPVSSFSPFTLASSTILNPLPVQLIQFNSACAEETRKITWSTVSEINNSHFDLEVSSNANDYELLETISGAGNSNQLLNYSVIDARTIAGLVYYRLVQIDYDGTRTAYGPVVSECNAMNQASSFNFHHLGNSEVVFSVLNASGQSGDLAVYSISGLHKCTISINSTGGEQLIGVPVSSWVPGIYLARFGGLTVKFCLTAQ